MAATYDIGQMKIPASWVGAPQVPAMFQPVRPPQSTTTPETQDFSLEPDGEERVSERVIRPGNRIPLAETVAGSDAPVTDHAVLTSTNIRLKIESPDPRKYQRLSSFDSLCAVVPSVPYGEIGPQFQLEKAIRIKVGGNIEDVIIPESAYLLEYTSPEPADPKIPAGYDEATKQLLRRKILERKSKRDNRPATPKLADTVPQPTSRSQTPPAAVAAVGPSYAALAAAAKPRPPVGPRLGEGPPPPVRKPVSIAEITGIEWFSVKPAAPTDVLEFIAPGVGSFNTQYHATEYDHDQGILRLYFDTRWPGPRFKPQFDSHESFLLRHSSPNNPDMPPVEFEVYTEGAITFNLGVIEVRQYIAKLISNFADIEPDESFETDEDLAQQAEVFPDDEHLDLV